MEDDVVGLPLTRFSADVHQRRIMAVERAALAVGIGRVFVAVEDLDFIPAHQVDAAIAAPLTVSFDDRWLRPFDVHLTVAKFFLGK